MPCLGTSIFFVRRLGTSVYRRVCVFTCENCDELIGIIVVKNVRRSSALLITYTTVNTESQVQIPLDFASTEEQVDKRKPTVWDHDTYVMGRRRLDGDDVTEFSLQISKMRITLEGNAG